MHLCAALNWFYCAINLVNMCKRFVCCFFLCCNTQWLKLLRWKNEKWNGKSIRMLHSECIEMSPNDWPTIVQMNRKYGWCMWRKGKEIDLLNESNKRHLETTWDFDGKKQYRRLSHGQFKQWTCIKLLSSLISNTASYVYTCIFGVHLCFLSKSILFHALFNCRCSFAYLNAFQHA